MKSAGIIKATDKLGRVVIPKELRTQLGILNEEDKFEIFSEDDKIILKKYEDSCVFCKSTENLTEYLAHFVCENCIEKLKQSQEEKKINIELSEKNDN